MAFRVSVVIPAYNSEEHVGRAIDSVLDQRRPADEIIVVDDGSTDGTAEIVKAYGDKVRYIFQENAGVSVARNTGIEAAKGDWIAFLDADDEWLADYLSKQREVIARNPSVVWAAANFYRCDCLDGHKRDVHDKGEGSNLLAGKEVYDDYFQAYINGACGWTGSLIVRRDVLIDTGLFTPGLPMGNDVDMWWRIAYRRGAIAYNTEPLAVYHTKVSDSITKKQRNPELLCSLIERHMELSRSEGAYERFKPCMIHMVKFWTYRYLFDQRAMSVNKIMNRFSNILKPEYRMIIRLLAMFPKLTQQAKPLIDKISGPLGIKR